MSIFNTANIDQKLNLVSEMVGAIHRGHTFAVPKWTARDILVVDSKFHPPKKGLSYKEGQARLLHDLASIELQALELALRTLVEFPEAPQEFREQLTDVALSEAEHLELCLRSLRDLQFDWGSFPVHLALWQSVSVEDELLDRILIVHRYLEGSGLDAGETLLRRLHGTSECKNVVKAVEKIHNDEVGHVLFGSIWYHNICQTLKIDSDHDFRRRISYLRPLLPKRVEPIAVDLRVKAGFSPLELQTLQDLRNQALQGVVAPLLS